jgi:kynurenine formamidase
MLIDLTVPLNENTPIYPGDPKTKINTGGILARDGYQDHYVCVGTHVGTHIDAPSHMLPDAKNIDEIPLEHFTGNGICIVIDKEFNLEKIKNESITEGDIVLFHTGMSNAYHESQYYEKYPAMPEEVANYLVEKKVKIVGVDMCSVDYEPFSVHRILLAKDILIIENLTNLKALQNKNFKITTFPLNVHLDGSPVRVVAEIL